MADEVKVYCKDCEFLYESKIRYEIKYPPKGYQPTSYYCKHPSNMKTVDSWFKQKEELISTPKEINAYNDCRNFKQKGN